MAGALYLQVLRQGAQAPVVATVSGNEHDATVLVSPTDIQDPATILTLTAECSYDGGLTWGPWVAATWNGGPQNKPAPGDLAVWWGFHRTRVATPDFIEPWPTHVRHTLSVTNAKLIGLQVT